MKKRPDKNIDEHPDDWEPPWMNPANDRKTPYTEEELEQFAEGFISSKSYITLLCCAQHLNAMAL